MKCPVRVYSSKEKIDRKDQLAWKIAEVASDAAPIESDVLDMVINRIIDNASVAVASLNRRPAASARAMAIAHPRNNGATVFGMPNNQRFDCEWAAWANGTAVRELDFHDTFLAADYSHPGDNIPPILAVAQQLNKSGKDLLRGIVTSYEIHVDLVKAICLHEFKKTTSRTFALRKRRGSARCSDSQPKSFFRPSNKRFTFRLPRVSRARGRSHPGRLLPPLTPVSSPSRP